jgi:hypothetical protein
LKFEKMQQAVTVGPFKQQKGQPASFPVNPKGSSSISSFYGFGERAPIGFTQAKHLQIGGEVV